MGRPPKFSSPEQFEALAEDYFSKRLDEDGYPLRDGMGNVLKPITLTGLCLHLDTTRETLDDYLEKPDYSDSVKRIKLQVESYYESRLTYSNATGPIFALKNFGWKDQQDHHNTGSMNVTLTSKEQRDAAVAAALAADS